jgi:hypothetical protein
VNGPQGWLITLLMVPLVCDIFFSMTFVLQDWFTLYTTRTLLRVQRRRSAKRNYDAQLSVLAFDVLRNTYIDNQQQTATPVLPPFAFIDSHIIVTELHVLILLNHGNDIINTKRFQRAIKMDSPRGTSRYIKNGC